MSEEIVDYGHGTNVLCKAKACERKIFVVGPTKVSVRDGRRYLMLKCPSPACGQICEYEENELELH